MTAIDNAALGDRLAAYASSLRAKGAIHTPAVEAAFATVPRHLFVYDGFLDKGQRTEVGDRPHPQILDRIYSDASLMTHVPDDHARAFSSTSQPSLVAKMIETLDLHDDLRTLEIGAGTGYNAALIATITGADVVTLDVSEIIAAEAAAALRRARVGTVTAVRGDGYLGYPAAAPYDRIVVTCGCTGISPYWLDQLAPGGRILVPTAHGGLHPVLAVTTNGAAVHGHATMRADFMTAAGPLYQWPPGQTPRPKGSVTTGKPATVPGAGPELDQDQYHDLWFYLATADPRITLAWADGLDPALGMCALHDPDHGTVWIQRDGTAYTTGEPRLLTRLTRMISDWTNHGQPPLTDWHCQMRPHGPPHERIHVPSGWTRTGQRGCLDQRG